jgi:hypothetical protein
MITTLNEKLEEKSIQRRLEAMRRENHSTDQARKRSFFSLVCALTFIVAVTINTWAAGRGAVGSSPTGASASDTAALLGGSGDDPFNLVLAHIPDHVTRCFPFVMTLEGEGSKWQLLVNLLSTAQLGSNLFSRISSSTFVRLTHDETGNELNLQLVAVIPEIDTSNTDEAINIVKTIILDNTNLTEEQAQQLAAAIVAVSAGHGSFLYSTEDLIFPCDASTGLYRAQTFRLRPITGNEIPIANEDEFTVGVDIPDIEYTVIPDIFHFYMNNRNERDFLPKTFSVFSAAFADPNNHLVMRFDNGTEWNLSADNAAVEVDLTSDTVSIHITAVISIIEVVDDELGGGVSVTLQNLHASYGGGPQGDIVSAASVAVVDANGNVVSVNSVPQEAPFTWDIQAGWQ